MQIKFFHTGHAGFAILADGIKIVLDHWSSSYRPFDGSWKKFEEDNFNYELEEILNTPDFVWCSHEHGDHFDPTYLHSISNPEVKFIVPQFPDNSLIECYKRSGINESKLVVLGDEKSIALSEDISVTMFFEEPVYSNHSSLFLKLGPTNILHNGDTTPNNEFYEKLRRGGKDKINLLIGQYCNPTPYPWIVEMEAPQKESDAFAMHNAAIETHVQMCNELRPDCTVPCAGPALVDNFEVATFKAVNELVYDKKTNLEKIRKGVTHTKVLDLSSGEGFELAR